MKKLKLKNKYYITTPIFYPNANLHMGHAYTTTLADIMARYHRLMDEDVYFLVGSDENTEKVVRASAKVGKDAKLYLDEMVQGFKELYSKLNISYDQFIRTSDSDKHWPGAEELWRRLVSAGDLEKRSYRGLYCVGHEAFITEKELVDGKCPEHDERPEILEEENYFFKLSKYTDEIKQKIESREFVVFPESRRNEILSLLNQGLQDISFSRPADKMSLGIPVPDDPKHKMYVWGDALVNYISALGFGTNDDSLYQTFWPADVQIIGKDILRFHAAIWPGMLLASKLPLPKKLYVHGFIVSRGRKMSKSIGNVINPNELVGKFGTDAVRYYLARHISSTDDSDMSYDGFVNAYNAHLANGLGNLVSRIMKMATTYGVTLEDQERNSNYFIQEIPLLESYDINSFVDGVWKKISYLDEYIQKNEPFKKIKIDPDEAKVDVKHLLSVLWNDVVLALEPIMPDTAQKIKTLILNNEMPAAPLFKRLE